VAVGNFGSAYDGRNKHIALIGRTYVTAEDEDVADNDDDDDDNDDHIPDNYIGTVR
jgi:hypothetical protein